MPEISAYDKAQESGQYAKTCGLHGKYDNIRRFWEDEELGIYLQPYLKELIERKRKSGEGLRVLDLGCGSGDGFELITSINENTPSLSVHKTKLLNSETIEFYKGIDINEGLLNQANTIYGNNQNMVFVQGDFNDCDLFDGKPYDLYLANYGVLSHNHDEQTIKLLSNIAEKSQNGALILIDWIGRYSYEWQTLWTNDLQSIEWMDYVISYIRASDRKESDEELPYFPLRIMGQKEVQRIYQQVKKESAGQIKLRKVADRCSFVGRHIDTCQYNPHCQPTRSVTNSLFELNTSTNLNDLLIKYVPRNGFDEVNNYHQKLSDCWNYLIKYTMALMGESGTPENLPQVPSVLRKSISTMKRAVSAAAKIKIGVPRSTLIEPQLGYCLRDLEMGLQKGIGCGHGIVAIFEVTK